MAAWAKGRPRTINRARVAARARVRASAWLLSVLQRGTGLPGPSRQ